MPNSTAVLTVWAAGTAGSVLGMTGGFCLTAFALGPWIIRRKLGHQAKH